MSSTLELGVSGDGSIGEAFENLEDAIEIVLMIAETEFVGEGIGKSVGFGDEFQKYKVRAVG